MGFVKKYWLTIVSISLIALFLGLRFGNINNSLFFFNDMGRDLLVLQDWVQTKKPPLLGPQTSALPINQSAIYFYMLMPAFLLSPGPMALLYTNAFVYIAAFVIGLYLLRSKPKMQTGLLTLFFLVSISPQYVIQSRFVWNPSFITPFLATGLISFYLLNEKFTKSRLLIFAFSLAIAISLSYSIAPTFIAIFLFLIFAWRKNRIKTILAEIIALFVINLPTVIFELKHKFLLTSMLLSRGAEPQKPEDIAFITKFNSLFGYGISVSGWWLIATVIILGIVILWWSMKKENKELNLFSKILAITIVVTFIVPLTIHSHYIFGFTTLLFLCIGMLPRVPKMIILLVAAVVYLNPSQIQGYFKPAIRTYDQMTQCFSQVCSQVKEPIFVSVQASFHPYHNGPEHRFMMKRAGCDVRYIEDDPNSAKLMAVVLDDSSFTNGETTYNELTMFGKSKEIKRYNCQPNFGVVILKKD